MLVSKCFIMSPWKSRNRAFDGSKPTHTEPPTNAARPTMRHQIEVAISVDRVLIIEELNK